MIVVITEAAVADLERIGDYIAQRDPVRALSFVQELRQRCEALANMPAGYPLVDRYKTIRRRSYRNYLIFYRVSAGSIDIIHILHGAMDYEAILFSNEQ